MMASKNGLTMLEATRLFLGDKWLVTAQLWFKLVSAKPPNSQTFRQKYILYFEILMR